MGYDDGLLMIDENLELIDNSVDASTLPQSASYAQSILDTVIIEDEPEDDYDIEMETDKLSTGSSSESTSPSSPSSVQYLSEDNEEQIVIVFVD